MSTPLGLGELLDHTVQSRTAITMATGYGSRTQELITNNHRRFGLKRPAHMSAPFWSLFPYTDLRRRAGDALVRTIHRDAIKHGARIITTGTWIEPAVLNKHNLRQHRQQPRRTLHPRRHRLAPLGDNLSWRPIAKQVQGRAWINLKTAVRQAAQEDPSAPTAFAIGGFGPVTDSHHYDPKTTPSFYKILEIHRATVKALAKADILLGETACNRREALAMAAAMREVCARTGKRWGLSFTPHADGTLRDGTRLVDVVKELMAHDGPKPSILGINCVPAAEAETPLRQLIAFRDANHPNVAIAVYPNGPGHHEIDPRNPQKLHWKFDNTIRSKREFQRYIKKFAALGANVIGGCCGTTCACGDLIAAGVDRHNSRPIQHKKELVCV